MVCVDDYDTMIYNWMVVLTILKNMKVRWEGLSHILWKINNVWTHQPNNVKACDFPLRQINGISDISLQDLVCEG